MNPEHSYIGHDAPEQADREAYPALDIQFNMAVVPVLDVRGGLQKPTDQVFPGRHDHHRHKIENHQIVPERSKKEDHQQESHSVDGAERTIEKATGDIMPFLDRTVGGLPHPATEGIENKIEEQQGYGISQQHRRVHHQATPFPRNR